jgi:hypothetical protein
MDIENDNFIFEATQKLAYFKSLNEDDHGPEANWLEASRSAETI